MSKSQKFKDNFLRRVKHRQFCLMRICFFSFGNKSKHKKRKKKNEGHNNFIGKSKAENKIKKNLFSISQMIWSLFRNFLIAAQMLLMASFFFSPTRNICEI